MIHKARNLRSKLQEMAVLYGRFHELLTLEQGFLATNHTTELAEMVKEKERLAGRIQTAEEERLALMADIAKTMNVNPRVIRVDDVAARLEKSEAVELLNTRTALQTVLAQVKALNEVNNQLLSDSMDYIRSALEIVTGKNDLRQGYGKSGQARTAVNVKRNLVNTRA